MKERLKWFMESCPLCKDVYENGLVIGDTTQAHYLFDTEADLTAEGTPYRYFDTKEEVAEFEKNNPPKNKQ